MKDKILLLCTTFCILLCGCSKNDFDEVIPEAAASNYFFYEQRLFAPDIEAGIFWRIPAILQLENGTLIAINDKRNNTQNDLPGDIDIVARRSFDNGRTWSEYQTIARNPNHKGYGDPAVVECSDGSVICVFCGNNGMLASTETDPINLYYIRSKDYGVTWSEPTIITTKVYGGKSVLPVYKKYTSAFFASGNGICKKMNPCRGRVMFVAAMGGYLNNSGNPDDFYLDNYVIYSDDNGNTWEVTECAFEKGNEAKLVELPNGSLLMSIRQEGARGYNSSTDGGNTWEEQRYWSDLITTSCNGDILSFTPHNGNNILLQSLPNSMNREDVSIFFSYDNGATWVDPVCICKGLSCYSSLTLLKDGSIGSYVEKVGKEGYIELWYQNFTYEWLKAQRLGSN